MKRRHNSRNYSEWSKRRTISTSSPNRSTSGTDSSSGMSTDGGSGTGGGSSSGRVKVRSRVVNRADSSAVRTSPRLDFGSDVDSTNTQRSNDLSTPMMDTPSKVESSTSAGSISAVSSPYAADIDEDGPCMPLMSAAVALSSPPGRLGSASSLRRARFSSLTMIPEDDSTSSCWSTGATKASSPALSGLVDEQQESIALDDMVDPMADDLEELLSFANVTDESMLAEQRQRQSDTLAGSSDTTGEGDLDFDTLLYKLASLDVSTGTSRTDQSSESDLSQSRAIVLDSSSKALTNPDTMRDDTQTTEEECPVCKQRIPSNQFGKHVSNCVSEIPEDRRREIQDQIEADEAYCRELIQSNCDDDGAEWHTDYWVECPICWKKLSIGDSINRHVNRCLDKNERELPFRGSKKSFQSKGDSTMDMDGEIEKEGESTANNFESLDEHSKDKIGGLLQSFMGSGNDDRTQGSSSSGSSSASGHSSSSSAVRPLSGREMIACANSLLRQPKGSQEFDTMLSMFETLGFNPTRMQRVVTSHANYSRKQNGQDKEGSVGPATSRTGHSVSAMDTDGSHAPNPSVGTGAGVAPASPATVLRNPFGSEGVLDPFSGRKTQPPYGSRVGRIARERLSKPSAMWSLDTNNDHNNDDECDADADDESDDELKLALTVPIDRRKGGSRGSSVIEDDTGGTMSSNGNAWDVLSTVAHPSRSPKELSMIADQSRPAFDIHAHSISAGAGIERMNDSSLFDGQFEGVSHLPIPSSIGVQRLPSPMLQSMQNSRTKKMSRSPTPTTGSEPPPLTAAQSARLIRESDAHRHSRVRHASIVRPPPPPSEVDSSMSGAISHDFQNIPLPSDDDL